MSLFQNAAIFISNISVYRVHGHLDKSKRREVNSAFVREDQRELRDGNSIVSRAALTAVGETTIAGAFQLREAGSWSEESADATGPRAYEPVCLFQWALFWLQHKRDFLQEIANDVRPSSKNFCEEKRQINRRMRVLCPKSRKLKVQKRKRQIGPVQASQKKRDGNSSKIALKLRSLVG